MKTNFRKNSPIIASMLALTIFFAQLPALAAAEQIRITGEYAIGGSTRSASFMREFSLVATGRVPTVVSAKVFFKRAGNTDMAIRIELRNPDGEIVDYENVDRVSGREESRTLTAAALNTKCNESWQLIVKGRNGQVPAAEVSGDFEIKFNEPDTIVHNHPLFGVVQGNTIEQNLIDPESPGEFTFTATWDSPLITPSGGVDLSGLMLTFVLLRDGQPIGPTATGYAYNAAAGNANPKMTFRYRVTAADLQGNPNWKIRILGSRHGDAENVRVTTRLVPQCFVTRCQ